MNRIIVHKELNDIIRTAEEKISDFHKVRKRIDSYKRVISALINKEVYQNCVDELYLVSQELKGIFEVFLNFDKENKRYFDGSKRDYLNAYKSYLECATLALKFTIMGCDIIYNLNLWHIFGYTLVGISFLHILI